MAFYSGKLMIPPPLVYSLSELLADRLPTIQLDPSIQVQRICADSRNVQPGDLFIAVGGVAAERANFVSQALNQGAVAALVDAEEYAQIVIATNRTQTAPIVPVLQLQQYLGVLAARFYGIPCQHLRIIGVTGTNGKTSISQFVARLLQQNNQSCAIIGTLGSGFVDHLVTSNLTTPGAIALQETLANLVRQEAKQVAMEVSSHSLVQQRIAAIPFEIAIFTNLTRDHLDYHGTMENYYQAKRLLFLTPHLKCAVINVDDLFGRRLLDELAPQLTCYAYSLENGCQGIPTVRASQLRFHSRGFSAHIDSPWGSGELHSQLLGRFNLSNLLAALTTVCVLLQLPLKTALQQLAQLPNVYGRMHCLGGDNLPLVVIDYAHTPDALEKALTALREHCQGRLWCVFGCGGNRDTGKRPLMATVAEAFADHVIVTDDNPRLEPPEQIIAEIYQGFQYRNRIQKIHDRSCAIATAINQAGAGDVVLIAGKGHETYQLIGTQKNVFSDLAVAQKVLDLL